MNKFFGIVDAITSNCGSLKFCFQFGQFHFLSQGVQTDAKLGWSTFNIVLKLTCIKASKFGIPIF